MSTLNDLSHELEQALWRLREERELRRRAESRLLDAAGLIDGFLAYHETEGEAPPPISDAQDFLARERGGVR